ncbi:MAG TPA: tyrosine-type recombinase/integrase [Streptosporangiaceae bacterium]|nr:tyrosine-type recombinase/integrase [Streptosporangiaceae bacterium]
MDHGSVFRRCGCRDEETGRLLGTWCPKLGSVRHGSWYFSADLPSAPGERRRVRRGGFATKAAAVAALEALTGPAPCAVRGLTTGEWLGRWLASRVSLRASTSRGYAAHMRGYLVPYLGGISLAELSPADVQHMFTSVIRGEAALGRPVSAATLRRIHATLRAALNAAVRAGLIASNPGRWPELPPAARPRPQVWTPALAERWEREGWRPVVGVWTAGQTAAFLARVRDHRLYALFHLVALRGLRRGEAAGLRWSDLDLGAGTLAVTGQLQQLGGRMVAGPPKSDAGRRVIALDKTTITALRAHQLRQHAERAASGREWQETGYVFTTRAGTPLGPDRLTRLFRGLVARSGLPPVTLHGLRHGAATLALAAGTDLKIVQDQLGHSTVVLTADVYTSVLPETARAAAENTAALLFPARAGRSHRGAQAGRRRVPAWVRRQRSQQGHAA